MIKLTKIERLSNEEYDTGDIARVIAEYADKRWQFSRLLTGTQLVTDNIDTDTSSGFVGIARINGTMKTYAKCLRSFGADFEKVEDYLDYADRFVDAQAKNESKAIESVIKGVVNSDIGLGVDTVDYTYDIEYPLVSLFNDNSNCLFNYGINVITEDNEEYLQQCIFDIIDLYYKIHKSKYLYVTVNPDMLKLLRDNNKVDKETVVENGVEFTTVNNGRYRLLVSRLSQDYSSQPNVNTSLTKSTIVISPGAISFKRIPTGKPTEISRRAEAEGGGGRTEFWYRYSFVVHPNDYDWVGSKTQYPSDNTLAFGDNWSRNSKTSTLSVLPLFHK